MKLFNILYGPSYVHSNFQLWLRLSKSISNFFSVCWTFYGNFEWFTVINAMSLRVVMSYFLFDSIMTMVCFMVWQSARPSWFTNSKLSIRFFTPNFNCILMLGNLETPKVSNSRYIPTIKPITNTWALLGL